MKFMFPGIAVPLEVPTGFRVKAFGLHNNLRAFASVDGELRYFSRTGWKPFPIHQLNEESFYCPQTVVLEKQTNPDIVFFPGIDVPLEIPKGYRVAVIGLHDDLKAFAEIDGELRWFSSFSRAWKGETSMESLKVNCDICPHTIVLEKIKMETNSIELPEPPEGYEVLAIGTHAALHQRRQEPEFQEAVYQFYNGKTWTTTYPGYGDTLLRDPEDLTILYRKIQVKEVTLGDVQDGDIFTMDHPFMAQPAGTKFMRYYSNLIVIGQPGGRGASRYFETTNHEQKTAIKVVIQK